MEYQIKNIQKNKIARSSLKLVPDELIEELVKAHIDNSVSNQASHDLN